MSTIRIIAIGSVTAGITAAGIAHIPNVSFFPAGIAMALSHGCAAAIIASCWWAQTDRQP